MKEMQALVYTEPNRVQIQTRPYPLIEAGDVVLKIDAVGICGSDMHAYHGHDPRRKPGLVLGHEFAGIVVESKSANIQVGARVTGNPLITCGVCQYCVQGRNNLCSNRTMVGMSRPGAFAQFMSTSAATLIELPQHLSVTRAALTEPAATALHAINLSQRVITRPLPECRTLIMGGGAIGLLAALLLRSYGVRHLLLSEPNALRRASAHKASGCAVIDPIAASIPAEAFDYVIDAVGSRVTRQSAFAAVKPGGVIMHIGLQDWDSEIDMRKLTLAEITLLGTYTYTTADLQATVLAIDEGAFGDLAWVEERPLADGANAFADLDKGRSAAAKIVLRP